MEGTCSCLRQENGFFTNKAFSFMFLLLKLFSPHHKKITKNVFLGKRLSELCFGFFEGLCGNLILRSENKSMI